MRASVATESLHDYVRTDQILVLRLRRDRVMLNYSAASCLAICKRPSHRKTSDFSLNISNE
jgi:hypothetical protein